MTPSPGFDQYAENYDAALAQGISVSGENKDYFAHGRLAWLAQRLGQRQEQIKTVMGLRGAARDRRLRICSKSSRQNLCSVWTFQTVRYR